jgi:hypothetical protein
MFTVEDMVYYRPDKSSHPEIDNAPTPAGAHEVTYVVCVEGNDAMFCSAFTLSTIYNLLPEDRNNTEKIRDVLQVFVKRWIAAGNAIPQPKPRPPPTNMGNDHYFTYHDIEVTVW